MLLPGCGQFSSSQEIMLWFLTDRILEKMDGGILPTPNHKGQRLLGPTSPRQPLPGTSPREDKHLQSLP